MQEISLDTNEINMIPKFCFRTYCLKIIDDKIPSPFLKLYVMKETFNKKLP